MVASIDHFGDTDNMRRRHYIVCPQANDYHLREIDAAIAHGIRQVGMVDRYKHHEGNTLWNFYFFNTRITQEQARCIIQDFMRRLSLHAEPA